MSLGDSFPAALKTDAITRLLRPGAVLKFPYRGDDGYTKEKRFVVLHVSSQSVMCIINTSDSHFLTREPQLAVCQVRMKQGDHKFMDHDSFIDCSTLRPFLTSEILAILQSSTERMLGDIDANTRSEIAAALKRSPNISQIELNAVLKSIQQ